MIEMLILLISVNLMLIYLGTKVFFPKDIQVSRKRTKKMLNKYKAYILLIFLVLLLNVIENKVIVQFTDYLANNSTDLIHSIEGNIVEIAQFFINPFLTGYFFITYVFIYVFLIAFSIILYIYLDDLKEVKATALGYLLNYLIAMPFFLFAPVYETWHVLSGVVPLIFSVNPIASDFIIWVNGINNCFPSLHTSIAITIAIISSYSNRRKWEIFAWISAISIILSTLYLGIHWITDVIGGIILGAFAAYVGYNIEYNLDPIENLLNKLIEKIKR